MVNEITGFSGYITARRASELYGINLETLWKRVETGKIPALRIERTLLVRPSDVLRSQTDDRRRFNGDPHRFHGGRRD